MRTSKDVLRHAELLRSRIEELDRRLAILDSERVLFESVLRGYPLARRPDLIVQGIELLEGVREQLQ